MKSLFESYLPWTAKSMDLHLVRQNIIAVNIANIDTPGYKAKRVEFEDKLQAALEAEERKNITRTDPKHLPMPFDPNKISPDLLKSIDPRVIQGDDNVDLDKEMSKMAKNAMIYNTLAQLTKKSFDTEKLIIQEGAR
ncbi:MAG: flagellar basal body rod protein FlgB [Desulfonauticus sp.]|nr:flagellar basal body rod protein FlgB [Desulfonauticus sp.]